MACVSLTSMNRPGSLKVLRVLLKINGRRQLSTSSVCHSSENELLSYQSPAATPSNTGMQAGPATLSEQYNQAVMYEPTLVANPSTMVKPENIQSQVSSHAQSTQIPIDSAMSEIRASNQQIQFSKRDLSDVILNQVDPATLSRVYYFDSLAFSKRLEQKGFTREQAEGCVECLVEIIGNTLEHQAKHMITKSEQQIAEQQLHTEIMSVKKDMVLLQKSEFSALRTETEKISIDIARIQSHFQDEVVKLKGQFTLDVNLERGRAVEAHAVNEKNLQMLNNKIETEIAHLKTTYEVYRNDIFKYAAGTVLTCTTLIIGFIRLWK